MKNMFSKMEPEARTSGLMLNDEKTKSMCLSRQKRRERIGQNVTVDTYNFEEVAVMR